MIREQMRFKGVTHLEMAKKMGIKTRTWFYKVNDPIRFTKLERRKLCRLLGITVKQMEDSICQK